MLITFTLVIISLCISYHHCKSKIYTILLKNISTKKKRYANTRTHTQIMPTFWPAPLLQRQGPIRVEKRHRDNSCVATIMKFIKKKEKKGFFGLQLLSRWDMLVNKRFHVAIGRRSSKGTKIGSNSHRKDVEAEEGSWKGSGRNRMFLLEICD